jgi:hypothetical protein
MILEVHGAMAALGIGADPLLCLDSHPPILLAE